ncbi:MAG: carboxypeptidase regulatory-like domain-containing protein, partial [Acidobacteria bacterium]|nr:carboxypeptidase regulatory-like domain-containing protein [Acidobacteriota bacterium]
MVQRWLGAFVLVLSVATGSQAAIQVAGRVVGPGGAPVPEARVELLARGGNVPGAAMVLDGRDRPEPAATTRTQADGTYRLEAPAPGMWRVRVEAPGFAPLQADLVPLLEPADLPDAALVADAGLTVRVAGPGGAPAAGALVVVRPDEGRPRPRAAGFWTGALRVGRTGPEGTVKFARGGNERLVVSATAPGLPLAARKGARGQSVALSLPKGRVVVIEVRDAAGQPVPGAALADPDDRHPLALSGDDGRCTLAVAGNSIGVWAGSPEGASTKAELALPQETKDRPVVITLPAVREVSGRVIDVTTRRPIAGAIIWTPRAGIDFVVSGESGAYSLVVPARREVELAAAAAGYLESDFRDAAVSPLAADAPTIALQPAAEVRGVVVDADGNAVAGAEVLATTAPRGPRDRIIVRIGDERSGPRALTGARGEFRVGQLDPAEGWVLTARAAGRAPGRAEVSGLVPHEIREGLRIELQPGATLTGRVVDAAGKPVRGATASLKAAPPEARGMRMFGPAPGDAALPEQRADSDAEGHFAIADLPAGRFDLTVRRAGFATRTLPAIDIAADGQPRDVGAITLEPGARVEGRVTDPAGAPIDDVTVMLIGGDAMAAAVAMMTGGEGQ